MRAEAARLVRLKRLEHLRALARASALAEAGRAEARLAQLNGLGERTAALIAGYAARSDAQCGADLLSQRHYLDELNKLAGRNAADVERARAAADARAAEAAVAERRRAAVEDRAGEAERRIAKAKMAQATPLGGRAGTVRPEDT